MLTLNVYAQTSNVQNLSIDPETGIRFISIDQERELDAITDKFENNNKSIDVLIVMPYHYAQSEALSYINTWMTEAINPLVLYINPYGSDNWNENVIIKAAPDVAAMISSVQLERIRTKIMIRVLEEKEVNYYDKVFGYKKETFSASLKYYMAVKLALSEFDHAINPPPIELLGIEVNGNVYKNNEDCFVERTQEPVTFKAVELFNRELPEYNLNWSSIAQNNTDNSNLLLTEKGENAIKFNCNMASFYNYVNASYGNKSVKVGVYSILFNVNKNRDWAIPGRMESITFSPSTNIENTLEDFRYEVITEGPVSNHKTYYIDTKAIEWFPAAQNEFGEATSFYPSGDYTVKIRLVGPKGLSIEKVHKVTVLPKYDLKKIQAIDAKYTQRIALENDTLYFVGPKTRDVNFKITSTDPKGKFWPDEPTWSFSKTYKLNGASITKPLYDGETFFKAEVSGYDQTKKVYVKRIGIDRVNINVFPPSVGNNIRRFATSLTKLDDIFKTINNYTSTTDPNLKFKAEFNSNIQEYQVNAEDRFGPRHHKELNGKIDCNLSLAGSFKIPFNSYDLGIMSFDWGLFVESKIAAKIEIGAVWRRDPTIPVQSRLDVAVASGISGELGGGVYGEAKFDPKIFGEVYVASAKGQFKVPVSLDARYINDNRKIQGVLTIKPVVLGVYFELKSETKDDNDTRTPHLDYIIFKTSVEFELMDAYTETYDLVDFNE
ncbi:MAG: hypothetical protein K2X86_06470 [Cytophagaceae bacterium]|nr:hypothetical protein [Cytophagaceae bacterium]